MPLDARKLADDDDYIVSTPTTRALAEDDVQADDEPEAEEATGEEEGPAAKVEPEPDDEDDDDDDDDDEDEEEEGDDDDPAVASGFADLKGLERDDLLLVTIRDRHELESARAQLESVTQRAESLAAEVWTDEQRQRIDVALGERHTLGTENDQLRQLTQLQAQALQYEQGWGAQARAAFAANQDLPQWDGANVGARLNRQLEQAQRAAAERASEERSAEMVRQQHAELRSELLGIVRPQSSEKTQDQLIAEQVDAVLASMPGLKSSRQLLIAAAKGSPGRPVKAIAHEIAAARGVRTKATKATAGRRAAAVKTTKRSGSKSAKGAKAAKTPFVGRLGFPRF